MNEPSGRLTTVATEMPAVMNDDARMTDSGRTSRAATPAPIDQNPPRATPSSSRATMSTVKFGAIAPSRSASTSRRLSDHSTILRSIREVAMVTIGALTAPARPVATTIRPAVPMLTSRSSAIAVRRPIGRNSESTSTNEPRDTDSTPSHPRRSELVVPGRFATEVMTSYKRRTPESIPGATE